MSLKGDKTRQIIREKAYQLFAQKGFKEVTMKDICASTGLSRGGLYRHYESTEQIFLEIINAFSDRQKNEVYTKIEQRIPAISKEDNSITRQYETSKSTWIELINYGIGTKEFNPVNPESVFHVILFAYQGVRMYSRLMKMNPKIPTQITREIRQLLLKKETS